MARILFLKLQKCPMLHSDIVAMDNDNKVGRQTQIFLIG